MAAPSDAGKANTQRASPASASPGNATRVRVRQRRCRIISSENEGERRHHAQWTPLSPDDVCYDVQVKLDLGHTLAREHGQSKGHNDPASTLAVRCCSTHVHKGALIQVARVMQSLIMLNSTLL